MRFRTLSALLCALLFAWPAVAQEQRGSIEGVVKDSSGAVLPGVTVEARSAGGGVLSTTSDGTGQFRFPSVLPGVYEVSATLSSFKPAKVADLRVQLGSIKTVDFTLALASVTEQVTVTAESPIVDVKQSARSTNIRAEQVDLLPHGRDFTTMVTQAPGANQESRSGGIMIDGASASENRYVVDGMETTNMINGTSAKSVLADFIEEVQVKSTGYPAEYGGSTGGVINVITKSGTNRFSGNVLGYWQGDRTTGANNPTLRLLLADSTKDQYITFPEDKQDRLEPGGAIGGPIMKDRMWFFGAYQPATTKTTRTVNATTSGNPNGTPSTTTNKELIQFLTANQTMQLSDKLRTRIAFNNSWRKNEGSLANTNGTDSATTIYTKGTRFPNWSLSGTADYVVSPKLFVGFRVGRFQTDQHDFNVQNVVRFSFANSNLPMSNVPSNFQHPSGYSNVPNNQGVDHDTLTRNFFQADATYYAHGAGDHQIKGGFQLDHRGEDIISGELQNLITLNWLTGGAGIDACAGCKVTNGPFGYYELRSNLASPKQGFITQGNVHSNVNGVFFQDTWTVNNKITINAGVRTENENVPAYTTAAGVNPNPIKFGFKDKIAPRAGFAYDVAGDGKTKVYGSWGIFYDIFKLSLPQGSFGGDKWVSYFYTLDTPNFETLRDSAGCPPACPGTLIEGPIDFRAVSVQPGLDVEQPGQFKPMRSQELSFGLERQLNNVMAASVRFVHKQLDRAIDDVGDLDPAGNEAYIIANPGEGLVEKFSIATGTSLYAPQGAVNLTQTLPKPKRQYDSVELALDKRFSNNWFFRGSYMWSRDYGNFSGLSQSDENGRTAPNVGRDYDYPAELFDGHGQPLYGVLPTDRTNQVKLQAIYAFNWGTTVGFNEYIASGVPVTRTVPIITNHSYPVFYNGRASDGRLPMFSQSDLYVQHELKVGGSRRVQLSANVLNLFDQRVATNRDNAIRRTGAIPLGAPYYTEAAFYAGQLNFDQLISSAVAAGRMSLNSRFLKDNAYQAPIIARFGVKFTF